MYGSMYIEAHPMHHMSMTDIALLHCFWILLQQRPLLAPLPALTATRVRLQVHYTAHLQAGPGRS